MQLELASEINPQNLKVEMKLAEAYRDNEDFNAAIDIEPNIIDYYSSRAKCHDKLGNKAKAEADRKKAEKLRKEPAIKKL